MLFFSSSVRKREGRKKIKDRSYLPNSVRHNMQKDLCLCYEMFGYFEWEYRKPELNKKLKTDNVKEPY